MKVVSLCVDDWANFQYDITLSLRAVGIDAYGYKQNRHISNYAGECEIAGIQSMMNFCKDADVVNIIHSNDRLFQNVYPAIKNKVINVFYTGTVYRRNPSYFNNIFNQYVNKSVICLGEFAGQGAKDEVYLVGAVDTSQEPDFTTKRPYIFGHYPSNPEVKGTDVIAEMVSKCLNGHGLAEFRYSKERTDSETNRQRMKECDIYIELFKPVLEGKKYGSFGITALEAAAMGKVVVTMNQSDDVYRKHYGECWLALANDEMEFAQAVIGLSFMTDESLVNVKRKTYEWVNEKHSHKATGEYMLKHIL